MIKVYALRVAVFCAWALSSLGSLLLRHAGKAHTALKDKLITAERAAGV